MEARPPTCGRPLQAADLRAGAPREVSLAHSPLRDLPLAGDAGTVVALSNPVTFPETGRVVDMVARCAAEDPGRAAVVADGAVVDYRELLEQVEHLERELHAAGCVPASVVACRGPRSLTTVVLYLAVERAGGIYLPLDPAWPAARTQDVLDRGDSALLVDYTGSKPVVEALSPDRCTLSSLLPHEPRYLIFTSGTTGHPKGAVVARAGMVNHLWAKVVDLGLDEHDRVAFTAPLVFDISMWQMLAPLLVGGCVVVVTEAEVRFPRRLRATLADHAVTVAELVPTAIGLLLDEIDRMPDSGLPALRWLISTGEELKPVLAERSLAVLPHTALLNAYGPTECSDDVTHHVVVPADVRLARLPVGRPIPNSVLYCLVFDPQSGTWSPAAPGEPGEVFVGGVAVGLGYLGDMAATLKAFYRDPFDPGSPTGRLYRTGDLGRIVDGVLHYLGRTDRQIKLDGVRMELDEIEAVLSRHPMVTQCAVTVREGSRPRLTAHYAVGEAVESAELEAYLRSRLPEALVPTLWDRWDALPLTANGKVDHQTLRAGVTRLRDV